MKGIIYRRYSNQPVSVQVYRPNRGVGLPRLDRIDQLILQALSVDARLSSSQISRKIGVAERTVHNRIRRLIEQDVFRPVAVINPAAFGYTLAVDIFCELEVGYQSQALAAIEAMPEITYIAISTGDQDLSLQALFKDSSEMQEFITHKLHQVPGMRRTRTVLIPSIIKDTYQWLPPAEAFSSVNGQGEDPA